MGKIRTYEFTSGGVAYNLDLGFTASKVTAINFNAADTEVWKIESYLDMMGSGVEIWHYMVNNDGGNDITTPVMKSSGGYLTAYNTKVEGVRQSITFDYTGDTYKEDIIEAVADGGLDLVDGERVRLVESGGLATGLAEDTTYYIINKIATKAQLSLTKGGTAVAFSSDGTGPNYLYSLDNFKVEGFKGVTISATFMSDGDVIYVEATEADRATELGDIG